MPHIMLFAIAFLLAGFFRRRLNRRNPGWREEENMVWQVSSLLTVGGFITPSELLAYHAGRGLAGGAHLETSTLFWFALLEFAVFCLTGA